MKPLLFIALLLLSVHCGYTQKNVARLIIRGDDMGYAHAGNQAIIESYKNGIERSVEIIASSPWFPEAVRLLQENPGIDVGVHLAITSEWDNIKWRPLSDCPSLKDADGYFFPMIWPNKNYPGRSVTENKWTAQDIEKEFRAQIELVQKKLPRVSHLSSHMGCTGINDTVKAIAKKLAKEYKVDIDLQELQVKPATYKGPHASSAEKINSFIAMLDDLKPGETYLFVDHPGLDSPELQAIHHIGYENVAADRQGVTDLFTSNEVKAALKRKNVVAIGYNQVK